MQKYSSWKCSLFDCIVLGRRDQARASLTSFELVKLARLPTPSRTSKLVKLARLLTPSRTSKLVKLARLPAPWWVSDTWHFCQCQVLCQVSGTVSNTSVRHCVNKVSLTSSRWSASEQVWLYFFFKKSGGRKARLNAALHLTRQFTRKRGQSRKASVGVAALPVLERASAGRRE